MDSLMQNIISLCWKVSWTCLHCVHECIGLTFKDCTCWPSFFLGSIWLSHLCHLKYPENFLNVCIIIIIIIIRDTKFTEWRFSGDLEEPFMHWTGFGCSFVLSYHWQTVQMHSESHTHWFWQASGALLADAQRKTQPSYFYFCYNPIACYCFPILNEAWGL